LLGTCVTENVPIESESDIASIDRAKLLPMCAEKAPGFGVPGTKEPFMTLGGGVLVLMVGASVDASQSGRSGREESSSFKDESSVCVRNAASAIEEGDESFTSLSLASFVMSSVVISSMLFVVSIVVLCFFSELPPTSHPRGPEKPSLNPDVLPYTCTGESRPRTNMQT
jgi:hypothetical protein